MEKGTNDDLHTEPRGYVPRRKMGPGYYTEADHAQAAEKLAELAPAERKRHGDPRFYALLDEIAELHSRKNHDYARDGEPFSNFNRARSFGVEPWRGVLVRMSDKWSRIEELSNGKTPKNESLRDSLVDNAVYSLICVLLLDEAGR